MRNSRPQFRGNIKNEQRRMLQKQNAPLFCCLFSDDPINYRKRTGIAPDERGDMEGWTWGPYRERKAKRYGGAAAG